MKPIVSGTDKNYNDLIVIFDVVLDSKSRRKHWIFEMWALSRQVLNACHNVSHLK